MREMSGVVVLMSYDTDPYLSKIQTCREVPRFMAHNVYIAWTEQYSFSIRTFSEAWIIRFRDTSMAVFMLMLETFKLSRQHKRLRR